MIVKNFSRHIFNEDQKEILTKIGFKYEDGCRSPFFKSYKDLIFETNNQVSSLVAPMGMILEALALGKKWTATIIDWVADQGARDLGRFAVNGMRIFNIKDGKIELVYSFSFKPSVETDFRTGISIPYSL
jgi:hypothetical protein